MKQFHLIGTRRRLGALGSHAAFDLKAYGFSVQEVQAHLRGVWSTNWQDIKFQLVEEVGP